MSTDSFNQTIYKKFAQFQIIYAFLCIRVFWHIIPNLLLAQTNKEHDKNVSHKIIVYSLLTLDKEWVSKQYSLDIDISCGRFLFRCVREVTLACYLFCLFLILHPFQPHPLSIKLFKD